MPRLLVHAVLSIPISIIVLMIVSPLSALLYLLSSLLVDVDHLIAYHHITGGSWSWNIRVEYGNLISWASTQRGNFSGARWFFLHRIEPWILIAYFAPPPLNFVAIGALSNLFLDVIACPERIKSMTVAKDLLRLVRRVSHS